MTLRLLLFFSNTYTSSYTMKQLALLYSTCVLVNLLCLLSIAIYEVASSNSVNYENINSKSNSDSDSVPKVNEGMEQLTNSFTNSYNDLVELYKAKRIETEKNCLVYDNITMTNRLQSNCKLFYIHIHKCGGSTVCTSAKHSNYRTRIYDNCNMPGDNKLEFHTTFDTINKIQVLPYQYAHEHNLNFLAQEFFLPFTPNLEYNNVLYFTSIRNPLDRILSHLNHGYCEAVFHSKKVAEFHPCPINLRKISIDELLLDPCVQDNVVSELSNFYINRFTHCTPNCTMMDVMHSLAKLEIMSSIVVFGTEEEKAE